MIWVGRGVSALLGEPRKRKSWREHARTGGRGRLSTICLHTPTVVPSLGDVTWEASLRVIRLGWPNGWCYG